MYKLEMSNFPQGQGNRGIARRRTQLYAAQAIPMIDTEIAGKSNLWMETICSIFPFPSIYTHNTAAGTSPAVLIPRHLPSILLENPDNKISHPRCFRWIRRWL